MSHHSLRRLSAVTAALFSLAALACSPDTVSDPASASTLGGPSLAAGDFGAGNGLANFEFIEFCKVGSTADITLNMTQASTGNTTVTHSFADGECRVLGNFDGSVAIGPADMTASESNIPAGFQFDSMRTTVIHRLPVAPPTVTVSNTNAFAYTSADNRVGILVEFFNSEIPTTGGGEGCTPGYWKQPHHFDSWVGYTQNQLFSSVFENAYPGKTLLQVLSANGNSAGEALGRHTVAALLNSANGGVSYDMSTSEVIAAFNTVFPGNKNALNGLKDQFEDFNQQGCPLN
jgi:hypothetical protein